MTWWPKSERFITHLPNGLSLLRGAIGISLPFFILRPELYFHVSALVLFILAAVTDYWDGSLARHYHLESKLGKILDPSMDKIFILTPLVGFAWLGYFSIWWIVPVILREVVITFCRIAWLMEGIAVGAEKIGKIKFVSQVVTVGVAFFVLVRQDLAWTFVPAPLAHNVLVLSLLVTLLFTVISGLLFLINNWENCQSEYFAKFTSAVGVGLLPKAPGTWGSAVGLLFALMTAFSPVFYISLFTVLFLIGYWSVNRLDLTHRKDPRYVVMDEVCGMMVALFGFKLNFILCVVGFLLFRLFDVWKPFPLRQLEELPGFWGIMMDDVGAGLYAWLILFLVFV